MDAKKQMKKNQIQNHKKQHASHGEISKRLRRASGHLNKVISMIDEGRKCVGISMQLHAVVKAIIEAKKTIIHEHIEHCLSEEKISAVDLEEFKEITKYL